MANPKGNPQNLRNAPADVARAGLEKARAIIQVRKKRQVLFEEAVSESDVTAYIKAQVQAAHDGDLDAAKWLTDNLYGKLPTAVVTEDGEGNTLPLSITLISQPLQPDAE